MKEVRPRSTWGALEPDRAGMVGMHDVRGITLHHSATPGDGPDEIAAIQRFHMRENGWSDIGYHYLVTKNGDVYEGRQLEGLGLPGGPYTVGAHVKQRNTDAGIGICILGNYSIEPFTVERQERLAEILAALCVRYHVSTDRISYHQAMALPDFATKCPGAHVVAVFDQLRQLAHARPQRLSSE